MTLLAAFQALLHRHAPQDVLIGSPITNRDRAETQGLIGFFVNTVVLRGRFDGEDLTFRKLLARVRSTVLASFAHQDLPFERLVEELRVERSLSHGPLFQVLFTLDTEPREEVSIPGLSVSSLKVSSATAKADLSLEAPEAPETACGGGWSTAPSCSTRPRSAVCWNGSRCC